jgi:hypothetical protein
MMHAISDVLSSVVLLLIAIDVYRLKRQVEELTNHD